MLWFFEFCAQRGLNPTLIIGITIAVVLVCLVVLIVKKLFVIAIGFAIFLVVVPAAFTMFFTRDADEGETILREITKYMDEDTASKVEQSFRYFKDADRDFPSINADEFKSTYDRTVKNIYEISVDKIKEKYLSKIPSG